MKKFCNPKPFLKNLVGEKITIYIILKDYSFNGILVCFDSWMNIQMFNTNESIKGMNIGPIGEIFLKCSCIQTIEPNLG